MFKQNSFDLPQAKLLIRIEMAIAALTILLLNVCWTPLIDHFTAGKYGYVNRQTIFILSLGIPLVYLNNFLWTMYFAQGRLKIILQSFVLAVCINVGLDVLLIPVYKNAGAAVAILISLMGQCIFYITKNELRQLNGSFLSCLFCTFIAVGVLVINSLLHINILISAGMAIIFFIALLLITRQINLKDTAALSYFLKD